MRRRGIARFLPAALAAALALSACGLQENHLPRSAFFVGIDVSGSFYNSKNYKDALGFLSYYIAGHLSGLGNLQIPRELFVGSIGGNSASEEQAKAFHPIEDFQGQSPDQITADFEQWFHKSDRVTDFNVFFQQVADICRKRNLSLAPITIVMVTDGIPAIPGNEMSVGDFTHINFGPLEYLSHNVTVRLLYASPQTASKWESSITRNRVRLWTVPDQVMVGWRKQLMEGAPIEQQNSLWSWMADNVDFRVRLNPLRIGLSK